MSENQKPVTKSYRDNWEAMWGKKEGKIQPACAHVNMEYQKGFLPYCPTCGYFVDENGTLS